MIVGILGAGRIGRLHAENIVRYFRDVSIKWIADAYMNRDIENWAQGLGVPHTTDNADLIFSDPEVDAVLICSSTHTHAEYICRCAQAHKAAFCEKPIDLSVQKIRDALEQVERSGILLQVGFVRRFDHNYMRLKTAVDSGACGVVNSVHIVSRDPDFPPLEYLKTSGGIFVDQAIHDYDMARYLAGSEPISVYARGHALQKPEIAEWGDSDTAVTLITFANGVLATVENSRRAIYGYDQRAEVFGSAGCARMENDAPNTVVVSNKDCVFGAPPPWFFLERYNQAFVTEMQQFFEAVSGSSAPPVTGYDGLQAAYIAAAATLSQKENRPVEIKKLVLGQ